MCTLSFLTQNTFQECTLWQPRCGLIANYTEMANFVFIRDVKRNQMLEAGANSSRLTSDAK